MFHYQQAQFDYEPYPICYIPQFLEPGYYTQLCDAYPALELFRYMPNLGNKYSLSELNHPKQYAKFIRSHPLWSEFHAYIKSDRFIEDTLAFLRSRHIELGFKNYTIASTKKGGRASRLNLLRRRTELSARFEFSMMNADGGHILPHTDAPNKLITLVISMVKPGEWNEAWHGGTQVVWPKDRSKVYNHLNKYMAFDEVEIRKEFPFHPNQCILFIKTYDSWHAVTPMHGPDTALRKTLTINIESKV